MFMVSSRRQGAAGTARAGTGAAVGGRRDEDLSELTRREREIVELASRGASNAEIAQRLVLSVRTVESHLYRAMAKLGAGTRGELRALQALGPGNLQ